MNIAAIGVEEMARRLAGDAATSYALELDFGGCRIRVESSTEPLLASLAHYYRGFEAQPGGRAAMTVTAVEAPAWQPEMKPSPKPPEPGKKKTKEEYIELAHGRLVRKRLTGMVFVFGEGRHLAHGPCLANDNQVINFINSRHIQWMLERGQLLCHAAAVAGPASGLALAGFAGMGKSTLGLNLMARGLDLVSNDRLLIQRQAQGLIMTGVAKLPRINPGTALNNPALASVMPPEEAEAFRKLPPDELWTLEHKYDVFVDQCFGPGRFRLASPMAGLVILNWQREAGSATMKQVELSQREDLMPAFMKSPGLFYLPAAGGGVDLSPQAYLDVLAGTPVYEVTGGVDFDAAALACLDALGLKGA